MTNLKSKWSGEFLADLGERVVATFLGALLGLILLTQSTPVDWTWSAIWPVLGVPTAVSLIKGLLANLANPESGASALPSPPGPEVNDAGPLNRNEFGFVTGGILGTLGVLLVIVAVVLLLLTLLKVFVVSWVALLVIALVGVVLIWVDRGTRGRVV